MQPKHRHSSFGHVSQGTWLTYPLQTPILALQGNAYCKGDRVSGSIPLFGETKHPMGAQSISLAAVVAEPGKENNE